MKVHVGAHTEERAMQDVGDRDFDAFARICGGSDGAENAADVEVLPPASGSVPMFEPKPVGTVEVSEGIGLGASEKMVPLPLAPPHWAVP